MEPVTHILTGVCLAKTGPNRTSAYATITMAIAAELPDVDTLWSIRGPVEAFQHHRGITHTFVGVPVEAAILVAAVWGWHRVRRRAKVPALPVRWGLLYLWALVGLLSHLLLDYTNNYGIRPFFPFDPHWFAGSFVFIFDPYIFLLLAVALAAPYLLGLVGSEVGARRESFRGRGLAIAALLCVVLWWSFRALQHGRAVELARGQTVAASLPPTADTSASDVAPAEGNPVFLTPQRVLASPDPLSPFVWSAVTDFGPFYQRADLNTRLQTLHTSDVRTPKPTWDVTERAAAASPLGLAYLDWSPMPFLSEQTAEDGSRTVVFQDPRFLGGLLAATGRTPLTGAVTLDRRGRIVEQTMDGRTER